VEIYNYSKKQDIYSPKREAGKSHYLYDQELKGFEYRYFTYDYLYSFFFSKRYINNSNEKNEVFWSNYDVQFNDLRHNMRKLKFKNEINFLLIDYPNSLNKIKKPIENRNLVISPGKAKQNNQIYTFTDEKCLSLNKMDSEKTDKTNNEELTSELDELSLDLKHRSKQFSIQQNQQENEDISDNNQCVNLRKNSILGKESLLYDNNNSSSTSIINLVNSGTNSSNKLNNINNNFKCVVDIEKNNLMNIIENETEDNEVIITERTKSPNKRMKNYNLKKITIKNYPSVITNNPNNNTSLENQNQLNNKSLFETHLMASNISIRDNIPFHSRMKNCIEMVENYLSKYKNFTEKFSYEIRYLDEKDEYIRDNLSIFAFKYSNISSYFNLIF